MSDSAIPIVSVSDVTKNHRTVFGEAVVALRGVSLKVLRNEIVAVVGPSGAGKSSLLRIIAGIDAAMSGRDI